MSENYFHPVFTDIGRAAAADDTGQGLQTLITHVVLGDGKYAVRDANGVAQDAGLEATALQNELLRVPVYSGGSPTAGALNLVAEVTKAAQDDPQFYISEIGFLDEEGVLIAVWSHASANLGYRGDVMTWYLSLGLAWVDLPGDQFAVQVQNAPLAEQSLKQAQLRGQVSEFVTSSGVEYADDDVTVISRAMDARIANVVESLDKAIRTPIAVTPANNAQNIVILPTLIGSDFFSADGYDHVSSQFRIFNASGDVIFDTGEVSAVTQYFVPSNTLQTVTDYQWDVRYKGDLGGTVYWSEWSDRSSFKTANQYIAAPTVLTPSSGQTNVGPTPSITLSSFNAVNGVDTYIKKRVQISTTANFSNIVWDSGDVTPQAALVVPDGILQEGETTYYIRANQTGQSFGVSAWSAATIFITKNLFAYNLPPVLVAPSNGAVDVAHQPILSIGSYVVEPVGHDVVNGAQYQVATDPEMTNLVWDSGVLTSSFASVQVGVELDLQTTYYWSARYRGDVIGWTEYQDAQSFETSAMGSGVVLEDGGIIAGQYDGYWLVVAPASMRSLSVPFGLYNINTTLTDVASAEIPDPQSGYYNTNTLIDGYETVDDGQGSIGPVAAMYCRDQGADYFLPNKEELITVFNYGSLIDSVDVSSGVTFADIGSKYAYSSTEQGPTVWMVKSGGVCAATNGRDGWAVIPIRRIPV